MTAETENEKLTRHLGKQFRAVVAVADELEETGILKQSKDEAMAMKDEAVKGARIAVGERDEALAELAKVAEKLRVDRKVAVTEREKATAQAKSITDTADVKAGGIMAVARKKVDEMTRRMGALEQDHVDKLAKYAEEETQARKRIAAILMELAAAQKRLSG
jgi:uncharacterized protein YoxC